MLDDGAGDGYFYDPGRRRKPGSFFYHFAEVRHYLFFPSLATFLLGAAQCYESGIYRRLREDHDRSHELWQRLAGARV